MDPGYLNPGREDTLRKTADTLAGVLKSCVLCPHRCRVDRTVGERGFCNLGAPPMVDSALPHHGEEPVLSGHGGAGTVFFSSCNMQCVYCQNWQISHRAAGKTLSSSELSRIMRTLQDQGCHNIDAVTPTPHLPGIISALLDASQHGLSIPLVYNCGGYENPDIIGLLSGIVDIYLPDFKYGNDQDAISFSGVDDYVRHAATALREMVRQVGDTLEIENGLAMRGIIIRHLVIPGKVESSLEVLKIIKGISTSLSLSLMSQYTPVPAVAKHPILGRRVTTEEYETVVNTAIEMGFDNLFVQGVSDRHLAPDFDRNTPFHWEE